VQRSRCLSVAAGLLALWLASGAPAGERLTGAMAPDFALKSLAGENVRLGEYRGQVVVLSFWASWCGECRASLEHLALMHEHYRDTGLALFLVSLDRDPHRAAHALDGMGMHVPVLIDAEGAVGRAYQVDSMPMTVLIDRDGVIRDVLGRVRRGEGGQEQGEQRLRALLRE
jgi:peroxiredoxin